MAKKNIRVQIPVGSPDRMLGLSEAITERHESFAPPAAADAGAAAAPAEESPLHHLPMIKFKEDTVIARHLIKSSRGKNKEAQTLYEKAYLLIGISEGQTSDTEGALYFMYDQVRGILEAYYKTNPEKMQEFGFNVVVGSSGGKRTVRAEIPKGSPDEMIKLGKAILSGHRKMGAESPLLSQRAVNMDELMRLVADADRTLTQARQLDGESQSEMEESKKIIGIAKKQKVHTKGTLRNIIDRAKKILLSHHSGEEEMLERWGFVVVITETLADKKTKRIEVIIPKGATAVVKNVVNGSSAANTGKAPLAIWEGEGPVPGNPTEIDSGNSWTVTAPSGILSIKNLSDKKTGRCKLTVSK